MIYLKIASIPGNCLEEPFVGQIKCDSFSHSVSHSLTMDPGNADRTSGENHFSEMSFSKVMDSSTPALYAACAGAKKLGTATISVTRTEADASMLTVVYNLGDAMISNVSTSGSGFGELPSESFSINYTTITSQVTQQNADATKKGVSPFGWDIKARKPLAPPA